MSTTEMLLMQLGSAQVSAGRFTDAGGAALGAGFLLIALLVLVVPDGRLPGARLPIRVLLSARVRERLGAGQTLPATSDLPTAVCGPTADGLPGR